MNESVSKLDMHSRSNPILVTGSHRSGSTWAGKMISFAENIGYIHEPFNVNPKFAINPEPFKWWFQYLCEENAEENIKLNYQRILDYKYPLANKLLNSSDIKEIALAFRDQFLFLQHRFYGDRPLVKDPIAVFSVEWLYKNFDMDVLVLIRHPAAFCSSLKVNNWTFDFNHFLQQPLLMDRYLYCFHEEIKEAVKGKLDIIDQGVLLWNCIHHVIRIYRDDYSSWYFARHEDLSFDPITHFKSIYAAFGIEFSDTVKNNILESCGSQNSAEREIKETILRDSKKNIWNWKNRLTDQEIERIRAGTSRVAGYFYSESEW